jgi:MbtH protein
MSSQNNVELYTAVVNEEEQYSIWPQGRPLPPGWRDAGSAGTKEECLQFIENVWTDMRPLSLRRAMAQSVNSSREGEVQVQ